MFRGQFTHSVDDKGRVSLPSRFRDVLAADGDTRFVLTPDPGYPCLHLYPFRGWEQYERKVSELPSHDPRIVRFRRLYVSVAQEGELDKVGRVRLPPEFRDRIRVERDVVFAGMGKIIEIWSKLLWEKEMEESAKEAPQILADVARELTRI
ncbi:MAG TPA: division/cell wall cluster transcriptional repressor MraZ [Polyangiaceae bacterium]|nr:division/cell wall cluster transcriptional repressor MraZ [Polyangiaceae bacterium]